MHKHSHGCCTHDCLHYCSYCNKVYCCKCGQEWGGYKYYYPYYIYPNSTYLPNYTTYDTTTVACGPHAH